MHAFAQKYVQTWVWKLMARRRFRQWVWSRAKRRGVPEEGLVSTLEQSFVEASARDWEQSE